MYLHRLLVAIFLAGLLGTAAELVLLEHHEDLAQLIPFAVIAAGIVTAVWFGRRPGPVSRAAFRWFNVVSAFTGALGLFLHFRGNFLFARENDPDLAAGGLLRETLMGATPALAPGMLVLLAAVGYAALVAERSARSRSVSGDS